MFSAFLKEILLSSDLKSCMHISNSSKGILKKLQKLF